MTLGPPKYQLRAACKRRGAAGLLLAGPDRVASRLPAGGPAAAIVGSKVVLSRRGACVEPCSTGAPCALGRAPPFRQFASVPCAVPSRCASRAEGGKKKSRCRQTGDPNSRFLEPVDTCQPPFLSARRGTSRASDLIFRKRVVLWMPSWRAVSSRFQLFRRSALIRKAASS